MWPNYLQRISFAHFTFVPLIRIGAKKRARPGHNFCQKTLWDGKSFVQFVFIISPCAEKIYAIRTADNEQSVII